MKKGLSLVLSLLLMILPLIAGVAEELMEPVAPAPEVQEEEVLPTPEEGETLNEEATEEPVEEATEEPTEEPVEEPTEEPTEEPVEEPTEEPTEEPVEEPTEEPTEELIELPDYALTFVFEDLDEDEAEVLTLQVGEKQTPDYEVTPSDAKIVWSSGDEDIAVISESGEVEGIAAGEVAIIATLPDGTEAELQVIVMEAPIASAEPTPEVTETPEATEEPLPAEEAETQEKGKKQGESPADSVLNRVEMQEILPDWALGALIEDELPQMAATQLASPYNLGWGGNYEAKFTLPASSTGYSVGIAYNGAIIDSFSGGRAITSATAYTIALAEFFGESGTYQFAVIALGDGTNTNDSNTAYSATITYTKPAQQLGAVSQMQWEGADSDGNQVLSFVMPSNANNDGYLLRLYYYNETTAAWEEQFYYQVEEGVGYVKVWDYFFPEDFFYRGQYAFSIQPISGDLKSIQNGPESPLSSTITITTGVDPNTDVAALWSFVSRLYSLVLGRAPDTGATTWLLGLMQGDETGASAARGFFLSDEFVAQGVSNSEFVTLVFQTCMGRQPDAYDVTYWTNYLDQGISRAAVLNEIVNSTEYGLICESYSITRGEMPVEAADKNIPVTLFVQRLYTIILNRQAERSGVEHWTDYLLNQGGSGKTVAYEFAFSLEFTNAGLSDDEFITRMYRALLNREPDAEGLQAWRNEIALNGREGIFNGFADSAEFALVMASYGVR